MRQVVFADGWAGFRLAAREALLQGEAPEHLSFGSGQERQLGLYALAAATAVDPAAHPTAASPTATQLHLPRAFVAQAQQVAVHREPGRWDLIYRMLWRLTHGERHLLSLSSDVDVLQFARLRQAVLRDVHKCHAFVRFRVLDDATARDNKRYIAWYEPDHLILPLAVPHFVERFHTMDWSILTPDASVRFENKRLQWGPGGKRADAPKSDAAEALWRTYYSHIFNPSRLNTRAAKQEMPQRFWRNMPEAELIAPMVREAPARTEAFLQAQPPRAQPQAEYANLQALAGDVRGCNICPWSTQTTQAVCGEGPQDARVMMVGEQPGDNEDIEGRPFVGPAGQLLAQAMQQAGLVRADIYVTNAVKHFKFVPRGKKRLHQKPSATDVAACKGWLAAEVKLVAPRWLICLGTSAALAVRGRATRLAEVRGAFFATGACAQTLVTMHPSGILRLPQEAQAQAFAALVDDLRLVADALAKEAATTGLDQEV